MARKRASESETRDGLNMTNTKRAKTDGLARQSMDSTKPTRPSPEEKQELVAWIDKQEREGKIPFRIKLLPRAPAASKKGARRKSGTIGGVESLLDEHRYTVDSDYIVEPPAKWEAMQKFRRCTVGHQFFEAGQCLLISHGDDDEEFDMYTSWKAHLHEVRAVDSEHVYLRVAWLNRPEDLPGGPRAYHGQDELIPSNDMSIIDALSINGSIQVKHWDEYDDESPIPAGEDVFIWRQTYDVRSKTLSACRTICTCDTPQNPDKPIMQCPNCNIWLHSSCIEEAAEKTALLETVKKTDAASEVKHDLEAGHEDAKDSANENGAKRRPSKKRKSTAKSKKKAEEAVAVDEPKLVKAKVQINTKADGGSKVVVTDERSGAPTSQALPIHCLSCKSMIE